MDAIASIAFSMIVVNAVKATGIQHADKIFKQTMIAGLIAAVALVFIYISLDLSVIICMSLLGK